MKLGFLGYGNLAMAIDAGIAKLGIIPAGDIFVCDSADTAVALARAVEHPVCGSAAELLYACDVVVILKKPKVFRELKAEFAALDTRGKRVVSCMAAVHTDELKGVFGCPVMRVMPTLASAGCRHHRHTRAGISATCSQSSGSSATFCALTRSSSTA